MEDNLQLPVCDDAGIYDILDESMAIIDNETYEVLFINKRGSKTLGIEQQESYGGKTCYEILHNRKTMCEKCGGCLDEGVSQVTWRTYDKLRDRHYEIKDQLMIYRGRRARLEIAVDITEQVKQGEALQLALAMEMTISKAINILYSESRYTSGLEKMFAFVGEKLQAERLFMYERHGYSFKAALEWRAEGVSRSSDMWNNILYDELPEAVQRGFDKFRAIEVRDVRELRDDQPEVASRLLENGVYNFCVMPLQIDKEIIGFFGAENILENQVRNMASLMKTLSYFISATLRSYRNKQLLETLSFTDAMTGVGNRNAFNRQVEHLKGKKKSLGVIFFDLNALKRVNDEKGHSAGDRLIISLAKAIGKIFRREEIFRAGGDEFVVLCPGISRERFEKRAGAIEEYFSEKDSFEVSIGTGWGESCENVQDIINSADAAMYEEKRQYYENHKH